VPTFRHALPHNLSTDLIITSDFLVTISECLVTTAYYIARKGLFINILAAFVTVGGTAEGGRQESFYKYSPGDRRPGGFERTEDS
jgi:ribulose 1,5-bisphosphate synthetase/thiazole synthase